MELERIEKQEISTIYKLMKQNFVIEEIRDYEDALLVCDNPKYCIYNIKLEDKKIGFMCVWHLSGFTFLEHFVIYDSFRNKGYGGQALDLLAQKFGILVLESEPPLTSMQERRIRFYERHGFTLYKNDYTQPSYRKGGKGCKLVLMSTGTLDFSNIVKEIYSNVYGVHMNKFNNKLEIRKLSPNDDGCQVAKLIYLTDPYVYPNWFDSIDDGIKVISHMIDLPTLYNRKNITVAVMPNGVIAGVIVSKQTPFVEDRQYISQAFKLANVKEDKRTQEVFEAYYSKMGDADDGYYIANVAVDSAYRNCGIATSMLKVVLEQKKLCSLECVIANNVAWNLYQKLGFKIAFEYPGVHGVPCYKMYYKGDR